MTTKQDEFKSVLPTFYQFKEHGDQVMGNYSHTQMVEVNGNATPRYVVDTGEVMVSFLGTIQLVDAFAMIEVGDYIKIVYIDDGPGRGANKMKIFEVGVRVKQAGSTEKKESVDG